MLALGLQGSPRKKGNSDILLTRFMEELEQLGCHSRMIDITRRQIEPCKEISVCETNGFCPIKDDMAAEIYPLLREADIVVMASPIFFYNISAQLKAVIDRSQALWARKYALKLRDPRSSIRRGFFIGVGATTGKRLFEGSLLTAKYFFDGIDARFSSSLTYSGIEKKGQIQDHAGLDEDLAGAARELVSGLADRRKILFTCRENACRSQMAAAFAQLHGGDALDVASAGSHPADLVNPLMQEVMGEIGIDVAHRFPADIETMLDRHRPAEIITMGCDIECPTTPGAVHTAWNFADPAGQTVVAMRKVRDDIEAKVKAYIQGIRVNTTWS